MTATLFVPSLSPGQAIRFFERQLRSNTFRNHTKNEKGILFLASDAYPPHQQRAVFSTMPEGDIFFAQIAPAVAKAFGAEEMSSEIILLYADNATGIWGFQLWKKGEIVETGNKTVKTAPLWKRFLPNHPATARETAFAWGMARGLPVDRTPLAPARQFRKIPVIDYNVVALLDQRSLLVEDAPRLYRFVIGGGS